MARKPYDHYVDSKAWKVFQNTIEYLFEEEDLVLRAPEYNIVGYLCKALDESGLAKIEKSDHILLERAEKKQKIKSSKKSGLRSR